MNAKLLLAIAIMCAIGIDVFAIDSIEENIKAFKRQNKQEQKLMLDNSLRDQLKKFLINNKNVSLKDFKNARLSSYASEIIYKELTDKYKANPKNYMSKIKDKNDRALYEITFNIQKKYNLREYFLCKSNEEQAMASYHKIWKVLRKNRPRGESDEAIKIDEQILEECKFEIAAINSLLATYRFKNYRKKYNELMLRIIKEDQVEFDFLYSSGDQLNTKFIDEYLRFFNNVNNLAKELILSFDEVKLIAESILTKHKEIFNFRNNYFIPNINEINEYNLRDGIQALINVSFWLRKFKLEDLNDQIISNFFKDKMVIDVMRYDPKFNDFMKYLQGKGLVTTENQ